MTVFKQITAEQAAEMTDSIVISVGGENDERITVGITWSVDGDVEFHKGPLSVVEAMDIARAKAQQFGKTVVYVMLQPDTLKWRKVWGPLQ